MNNVFEKVQEIVSQIVGVKPEEITLQTSIADDLNADSLDWAEMIMEIETEFDVKIADEDAQKVKTIGDIVALLEKK